MQTSDLRPLPFTVMGPSAMCPKEGGSGICILEDSITVEKHMAEVFDHSAFSLVLDLDMPTIVGLGPSGFNHTVLQLDVSHAPPFDGAALVICEYLRALNVAGNASQ